MADEKALEFGRDDSGHRYQAFLEGKEVAFVEVDPVASDGLIIKHTEVLPALEGQGIGGRLMKHLLDDARERGLSVIPACSYAASYIKRHPEYLSCVRESHRAALDRSQG